MRALVRRVSFAEVKVASSPVGSIGSGLLVYLGIHHKDETSDLDWIIKKVLGLRVFEDEESKMNLKIGANHGILLVSQFTLLGNLKKGYRPSFNRAADPRTGAYFYDLALEKLKKNFTGVVESGIFGADMQIHAVDEGPVTIWIDSQNRDY